MEQINKNISMNLKKIRKDKGLTLEDLSVTTTVSKSMLGEIERGRTNPTILVLWKIAEGLKVPLSVLLEEEKKEYMIVRNDKKKPLNSDAEFSIFNLFPYYNPHKLEIHKIELGAFSKLSNSGHMNGVDEYIFLTDGEVKVKFGETEIDLFKGDAIRFNAENYHEIINKKEERAFLLNVMVYR